MYYTNDLSKKLTLPSHNDIFHEYREEIESNIDDWFRYNEVEFEKPEDLEKYYDTLWVADDITGNASGSFYCNAAKAEVKVQSVIFSEELLDMFKEFGYDRVPLEKGAEFIDVSIRCFLLSECLQSVIEAVGAVIPLDEYDE